VDWCVGQSTKSRLGHGRRSSSTPKVTIALKLLAEFRDYLVKKQTQESGSDGLTSHLQRDRSELEKSFLRRCPNCAAARDEWRSSRKS
jgi:hypothetical protein